MRILLKEIHEIINEITDEKVKSFGEKVIPDLHYPPGAFFETEEKELLEKLLAIPNIGYGLKKILNDVQARIVFHLFAIIDGVGDPVDDDWSEVILVDRMKADQELFLHDEFYSTYWDWLEDKN